MSHVYVLKPYQTASELKIDYKGELNEQQLEAVTAPPGPALVIAGAGSGKTRTLTYRVAYLIEQGIPAERILLLTFTNKAAREMMRRVTDLLGGELGSLWGGTFHSIGHRILRRHADLLGYRKDFTILDREDATDLLKACVAEAEIDMTATRFPKADVLADIFSMAVNTDRTIVQVLDEEYGYFHDLMDAIVALSKSYQERKRATNVVDFDDLLVLWLKLMRDHNSVCEQYQRQFQFILVDEYQDTNRLQSDLIDLLAARHHNVMVVGDDAQSIYSWRGADFRNILEFPKRYPDAKLFKIEVNYRSTPEILAFANAAIAPNVQQFAKQLAPVRRSGSMPTVVACGDARVQATFVAQRALELREEGISLNRMAVLYRSHFHALELQLELTRRNIPFTITSGIRFFEQAHIKDVTSYIRLICNPNDELAFKRMVQLLPGIGGTRAGKLWNELAQGVQRLPPRATDDAVEQAPTSRPSQPLATVLQGCAAAVPKKTAVAWAQLCATIAQLEDEPTRHQPAKMITLVLEAVYADYLKETFSNYRNRREELDQLASFAASFTSPEEFLSQLALLTNLEAEDQQPATPDDELLRLSTVHQAKGLEFDAVFVIMLAQKLFPSARSIEDEAGLEEERRLFYVAVTRARTELYLSYPLIRASAGSSDMMQQRSCFLSGIPKELFAEWDLQLQTHSGW